MDDLKPSAFRPPLSEAGLRTLGMATYNWGMADALLQLIIEEIGSHTRPETAHLSIGRKADRLLNSLDEIVDLALREKARQFALAVKSLNEGRNHAIHGFWGWYGDDADGSYRAAAYSYKSADPLFAEEIVDLANRIAEAARLGYEALCGLTGVTVLEPGTPNFYFGRRNPFQREDI